MIQTDPLRGDDVRPEETANVLDAEGWLRTGDMGPVDERGYVKLTDRKKDMILVSGFKVYPNEVEEVAMAHPGVLEATAIAAADARSDHVVKLVVVRRDPALTEEALIEHCRRSLTGYKVPKYMQFRDEPLPKNPVGNVLRRLVREQVEQAAATHAA